MGLAAYTYDPCMYTSYLTPGGGGLIYIGLYVYYFVYFRKYYSVE